MNCARQHILEFKRERNHENGKVPFLLEDFYILVEKGRKHRGLRLIRNHI